MKHENAQLFRSHEKQAAFIYLKLMWSVSVNVIDCYVAVLKVRATIYHSPTFINPKEVLMLQVLESYKMILETQ